MAHDAKENVDELVHRVKTPDAPEKDLRDPEVFRPIFEEANASLGLYMTNDVMIGCYDLLDDLVHLLNKQDGSFSFNWSGKVDDLEELIYKVNNPLTRKDLLQRFMKTIYAARKTPNDRAHSFNIIKNVVGNLTESSVIFNQQAREELGMIAHENFEVPSEEQTDEEREALLQAAAAAKAEALKKAKKKPKSPEEEAAETDALLAKMAEIVINNLTDVEVEKAETAIELKKTEWLMDNHLKMDSVMWDKFNRKMSILDIDVGEQEIIFRADLDAALTPFVPLPPIEEEFKEFFEAQAAE